MILADDTSKEHGYLRGLEIAMTEEPGQEYSQVVRMLGNGRCECYCFDGVTRLGQILCGNQPVRRVYAAVLARGTGIATPSSRRRVDGVEDDAAIQHERAVKF